MQDFLLSLCDLWLGGGLRLLHAIPSSCMQFISRIGLHDTASPSAVLVQLTMWRSEVAEDLLSSRLCRRVLAIRFDWYPQITVTLTVDSSVVGLYVGALDFAILNH